MDSKRHSCGWSATALVAVLAACSTGADDRAGTTRYELGAPRLVDLNPTTPLLPNTPRVLSI